jgi:hypothetical protein
MPRDRGHQLYVTGQAQHCRWMAQKTAEPMLHATDCIWGSPPHFKEVLLTLVLGWRPLKIWIFVASITNEFIVRLDILHAYDVFHTQFYSL